EKEADLVLGDQLHVLAHSKIFVRLAVVELERELVGLAADLNAALLIDLVDRELVGIAIVATGVGVGPRQLHGGAERDRVALGEGRRRGGGQRQSQASRQQ